MKIVIKATLGALLATWLATSPGLCQQSVDRDLQAMFPESIRKSGVLRVGVSAPAPPFVMQAQIGSQDYQGVDPDLARAVAQRAGLKAEFRNFAFSGLLAALQADQIYVLWTGLLPSKDRLAVANFAVYFRNPFGILVAKGNPLRIAGVSDLCGHKVARVEGSTPPAMIIEERQAVCASRGLKPIAVTVYPNAVTCQLAIKSGAADAMVGAGASAAYIANTVEDGKAFDHVVDKEGLGGTIYFADGVAVPRENAQLLDAVQRGLQALVEDGSYLAILKKHGQQEFAVAKITINKLE
jgi:polar amino acid transport system substrate-binding protein